MPLPQKNLLWPKISLRINKQEFDDEIGRFDDEDVQATSLDWRSDSSKRFSSQKQCVKRSEFPYVFPGLIIEVLETYAMFVATQLAQSSLLKPAIWLCISSRFFFTQVDDLWQYKMLYEHRGRFRCKGPRLDLHWD